MYRHREITSKAVSAILMLSLKWLKVSRKRSPLQWSPHCKLITVLAIDVMKFHHLGQLLLDSNCLLLVLKMFGLQEVASTVIAKNDIPEQK